jgi:hypothetical protein
LEETGRNRYDANTADIICSTDKIQQRDDVLKVVNTDGDTTLPLLPNYTGFSSQQAIILKLSTGNRTLVPHRRPKMRLENNIKMGLKRCGLDACGTGGAGTSGRLLQVL